MLAASGDNPLVKYWRRFEPRDGAGNVHPDDQPWFPSQERLPPLFQTDTRYLPQPYVGDLGSADVFVVYVNPGASETDQSWNTQPEFRSRVMDTMRQKAGLTYPFYFFDPALAEHSGFGWFRGNLGDTKTDELVRRFAAVELYPYHSPKFASYPWQKRLPSFQAAVSYVRSELIPRAKDGKICLVIVRGATHMQPVAEQANLVVYRGIEPWRGSVTLATRGGKAVQEWVAEHPRAVPLANKA